MEPSDNIKLDNIILDDKTAKLLDRIANDEEIDARRILELAGHDVGAFQRFLVQFGLEETPEAKLILDAINSGKVITSTSSQNVKISVQTGDETHRKELIGDLQRDLIKFPALAAAAMVATASAISMPIPGMTMSLSSTVVPSLVRALIKWIEKRQEATVTISIGEKKIEIKRDSSEEQIRESVSKILID